MNTLIKKFLEKNTNKELLDDYLVAPTDFKKQYLQKEFNEFYMEITMLSYFSKSLHFFAQKFDKKRRDENKRMSLSLDNSDDYRSLQNIPDDKSFQSEISYNLERVEDYFENKIIFNIVSNLTLNQKRIIYLFYIKNKSDKEIALTLGISIQAVNKQRNAILNKIRGEFNDGLKRYRSNCG